MSTEQKKKYGRPNFGPGSLSITYQQEPDVQYGERERKEAGLARPFYLAKTLQLRVEGEREENAAVVRNLESGYRRRVEFGYIWASHSHFPRCQKGPPLSIIQHEQPARRTHSAPRPSQTLPAAVAVSTSSGLLLPHSFTPCRVSAALCLCRRAWATKRLIICPHAHVCLYRCCVLRPYVVCMISLRGSSTCLSISGVSGLAESLVRWHP